MGTDTILSVPELVVVVLPVAAMTDTVRDDDPEFEVPLAVLPVVVGVGVVGVAGIVVRVDRVRGIFPTVVVIGVEGVVDVGGTIDFVATKASADAVSGVVATRSLPL